MPKELFSYFRMKSEDGFTLIEIAVVMIIGGLIIGSLASSLVIYQQTQLKTETENRLEIISDALRQYLDINQKYPCPADRTVLTDTAGFGTEDSGGNCQTGIVAGGTTRVAGVRIGSIPTRALSIPDEYSADAWGNRFTYAVTEVLAEPGGFTAGGGAISVVDSGGNSLVTPAGQGHYAVVSHGASGLGATTLAGVATAACPAAGATFDEENCDADATFLRTINFSEQAGANFFDDYITFQGETNIDPNVVIPTGAIMAFDLTTCPAGWTQFAPLQDRYAKGSANVEPIPDLGTLAGSDTDTILPNELPSHTHADFPLWGSTNFDTNGGGSLVSADANGGGTGTIVTATAGVYSGDPASNIVVQTDPQHVVLLYCEKD